MKFETMTTVEQGGRLLESKLCVNSSIYIKHFNCRVKQALFTQKVYFLFTGETLRFI